eukprot:TRINITY_DN9041_c0_g1_i10.p1 TRINITY_DN9041_c0_g1~~TRINITY_DN9041_c0_g1_i10.p1  ORF type:complete len:182 (+),score=27.42 TRINITY_DN9041_c0_g1_i10:361-906(+)
MEIHHIDKSTFPLIVIDKQIFMDFVVAENRAMYKRNGSRLIRKYNPFSKKSNSKSNTAQNVSLEKSQELPREKASPALQRSSNDLGDRKKLVKSPVIESVNISKVNIDKMEATSDKKCKELQRIGNSTFSKRKEEMLHLSSKIRNAGKVKESAIKLRISKLVQVICSISVSRRCCFICDRA